MNRPSSIDNRIADWLEDGPTTGPARALATAHARARSTCQRPAWIVSLSSRSVESSGGGNRVIPTRVFPVALAALLVMSLIAGAVLVGARLLNVSPTNDDPRLVVVVPRGGAAAIAFDADGDIYTVRADGSDLRQLTTEPSLDFSPVWSPDGTRIAYFSTRDNQGSLKVLDVTTGAQSVAASDIGRIPTWQQASWSPDGRTLAYHASAGSLAQHLYTVPADASADPTRLPDGMVYANNPAWSPDGSHIAYRGQSSMVGAGPGVFALTRNEGGSFEGVTPRRLSAPAYGGDSGSWALPLWSPKRDVIVVEAAPSPEDTAATTYTGHDIMILAGDGSGQIRLSADPSDEMYPTWSPDGRRIAFGSNNFGAAGFDAIVIDSDGSNRHPIAGAAGMATKPLFWSPDGSRLLGYRCGDECEVTILNLDGSSPSVRVPAPGNEGNGTWQPNAVPIIAGTAVASITSPG